ncbi:MAG: PP2C family protein-serine/threonine phosphatase [Acidimicrobiia bacterium]
MELDFEVWDGPAPQLLDAIVAVFVMAWIVKGRYTDTADRARRSEPLSAASEVQWDLLPPLACSTEQVALGGILEPAYEIGGDSFDYAFDASRLDFAIVDAIGRGMSAVLMSAAAINSLRNSRRARFSISAAYDNADRAIAAQFGDSYFVTGLIGTLDLQGGTLTWINAGHVLPMLVRNGTYAGPLLCTPSVPFGLGGPVREVAEQALQPGDRVLFYTDGITEARSTHGSFFGDDQLSDLLVRASLENLPVQETVRHLADSIISFSSVGLRDDATMLLMEYRPPKKATSRSRRTLSESNEIMFHRRRLHVTEIGCRSTRLNPHPGVQTNLQNARRKQDPTGGHETRSSWRRIPANASQNATRENGRNGVRRTFNPLVEPYRAWVSHCAAFTLRRPFEPLDRLPDIVHFSNSDYA